MKTLSTDALISLSKKFDRFAEEQCRGNSTLYYDLSKKIAGDEELLRLCVFVRDGQPVPNAFLAAVHFFILKHKNAFLAKYYPSVTGQQTESIPFDLFKAFVREHQHGIENILQSHIVQTNVPTRCNYLLPVFSGILSRSDRPATIIDIGASAGLNLNFDRYAYYYDDKKVYGDSRVQLHCRIKEGRAPVIRDFNNPINKIGIDQHPIDLANADDIIWLQALIWPDQTERFLMLEEALSAPYLSAIQLVGGSTIADFRKIIEAVAPDDMLIIYATHVLYQFTDKLLSEFYNFLDAVGQSRDCCFLSAEATEAVQSKYGIRNTAVVLTTYINGQKEERLMAETNGHGNWIKWI